MTQANDTQTTSDVIARTLESLRAASEDLAELAQHENGIHAVVQSARGTALISSLRRELNHLSEILPLKS